MINCLLKNWRLKYFDWYKNSKRRKLYRKYSVAPVVENGFTFNEYHNWFPSLANDFTLSLYEKSVVKIWYKSEVIAIKKRNQVTSEWISKEIKK